MSESEAKTPRLTVICPVYNEERVIPLFFSRAKSVIDTLQARYSVDLVFVNNASTDNTYSTIEALRKAHPFVFVITLSSNVGYQRSLECGLRNARGDLITLIDVDCEDPPEMILNFVARYEEGFDIVYGERVDREEGAVIKRLRKLFYHIVRRVADEEIILYMAEFSLFTSEVRDALLRDQTSFPFIRGSIARVGFRRIGIPYKRARRVAGETHYNVFGMTVYAVAALLASSTLALRLPIYFFPFWIATTVAVGALGIVTGDPWLHLANAVLAAFYLGGTAAFTALYVARTYKNGLGRPNYTVHRRYTHLPPS